MSSEKEILIQIEHLKKYFPLRNSKKGAAVRAVEMCIRDRANQKLRQDHRF